MKPGASTVSFVYHFEHEHPTEWKQFQEELKQDESPQPPKRQKLHAVSSKQPSMLDFSRVTKAEQIEDAIMCMIAVDADPISKVEKPGFVNLLKVVLPNFALKGRNYFAQTVLPRIYQRMFSKIKADIDQASDISFTADVWTSRNSKHSLMSLTGHCLDAKMKPKFFVLDVIPVAGKHDAANLSAILQDAIGRYGIEQRKCHVIVRDGGMRATTEAAGFTSVWCWAHVLNRAVIDGIKAMDGFNKVIEKVKRLVRKVRKARNLAAEFSNCQTFFDLPSISLKKCVGTVSMLCSSASSKINKQ